MRLESVASAKDLSIAQLKSDTIKSCSRYFPFLPCTSHLLNIATHSHYSHPGGPKSSTKRIGDIKIKFQWQWLQMSRHDTPRLGKTDFPDTVVSSLLY